MEEKINKIVELEIDLNDLELDDMGVEVVSLVTEPAIEVDFVTFNSEEDDSRMRAIMQNGNNGEHYFEECDDCFDLDDACWPGYEPIGTKIKDGREVPNCVPIQNNQEFESYNDYPDSVKNNAKRGIELNEKVDNKCATQVGKVRAQQLANGENITLETIKRMYSYLSRAETYYDPKDTEACGTISYLLWGGKTAKSWAESKLKSLDELEKVDHNMMAIMDWAEEDGEEITEDMMFISENNFNFDVAQNALGLLNRLGIDRNKPQTYYKYSGPQDSGNRRFCSGMMRLNRMYNEKDIRNIRSRLTALNPKMGEGGSDTYDVFKYKGGVSCRHYWTKLSVWTTENGQRVIVEDGPARGNAGKSNNKGDRSPKGAVANNASVKHPGSFSFAVMDDDQRIAAGPLMIPNSMILRRDENGDPYYVYFSKETIKKIQERFNREYKINNTDVQHDGNVHTDNVLLEQWIIEHPTYDKSNFYGFNKLNMGTWFGVYRINNDSDWERIKSGELKGFSVAGSFIEKAKPVKTEDDLTLEAIIKILKEIK